MATGQEYTGELTEDEMDRYKTSRLTFSCVNLFFFFPTDCFIPLKSSHFLAKHESEVLSLYKPGQLDVFFLFPSAGKFHNTFPPVLAEQLFFNSYFSKGFAHFVNQLCSFDVIKQEYPHKDSL